MTVPAMTAQLQRLLVNKKWAQAITNGDFDDDDAQQVKGIDAMDDGNLARRRRQQAAQTAYQYVDSNYSASSLPRDRNGLVPPDSRFPGPRRGGRFMPARQVPPMGDEPVDINATFTAPFHRPAPHRPVSNGSTSTRAQDAGPLKLVPAPAASSVAPKPPLPTPYVPHLAPGAVIILRLPISMQSAALPDRGQRYQAKVVLILGRTHNDDKIVFNLDKEEIADVEYSIGEYANRMDVSSEALMLQFTANKKPVYYAVDFGSADGKRSFDESLRKLVDRLKQWQAGPTSPTPDEARKPTPAVIPPAAVVPTSTEIFSEPPKRPKVTIPGSKAVQNHVPRVTQAPVAARAPLTSEAPTPSQAPIASSALPRASSMPLSPQLTGAQLDDIVACVVDTAIHMRDFAPEDYSIGTMKSVIRGATAAFMMRENPDFAKLSSRNRAELVEGHWIPAVSDRFFSWLRTAHKDNAQKELQGECLEKQGAAVEIKACRVYNKVELMALKPAAVDMTHKLPGKKAFEDRNLEERRKREHEADMRRATTTVPSIESQISRAASATGWLHGREQHRPAPPPPSNPTQFAPKSIAADSVTAKANPSTMGTEGNHDGAQALADWVYGPEKTETAEKDPGLNSSIHNRSNTDVLGANAGQFTGVFTQSAEFQDLVGIFNQADQSRDEISHVTQELRRLSLE